MRSPNDINKTKDIKDKKSLPTPHHNTTVNQQIVLIGNSKVIPTNLLRYWSNAGNDTTAITSKTAVIKFYLFKSVSSINFKR